MAMWVIPRLELPAALAMQDLVDTAVVLGTAQHVVRRLPTKADR